MAACAKRGVALSTIRGSCLCGGVKFEINGPLIGPSNCHCSNCRKQQALHFAAGRESGSTISNGSMAKVWSRSTSRRPAATAAFAACAALRSSTNLTLEPRTRPTIPICRRDMGSRSAHLMTIPVCARPHTSLFAARHHGSRSPTPCRNTPNECRAPKTGAGRGTAIGRRGCEDGRVLRSGAAEGTPCLGSATHRDRRRI
jgi:hypothetical protein